MSLRKWICRLLSLQGIHQQCEATFAQFITSRIDKRGSPRLRENDANRHTDLVTKPMVVRVTVLSRWLIHVKELILLTSVLAATRH